MRYAGKFSHGIEMSEDMEARFKFVRDIVAWLADEDAQRRFGSVDGIVNFFYDAFIEEYVKRCNSGLGGTQLEALAGLAEKMNKLVEETPQSIDREIGVNFIDDDRWKEVIKAAKHTLSLLENAHL